MNNKLKSQLDKLYRSAKEINLVTISDILKTTDYGKDDVLDILNINNFLSETYTPKELALLIVELGRLHNPKTIIDICCGVGIVLSYCDYGKELYGIDINHTTLEFAKILNPKPKFSCDDILQKNINQKYDFVIGDFPFGMRIRKDNISYPGEYLFISKALSLLAENGTTICIVPNSFLWQENKYIKELRSEILSKYSLEFIIHIPAGKFLRNTSIKCAIIGISNSKPNKSTFITEYTQSIDKIMVDLRNTNSNNRVSQDKLKDRWDKEFFNPEFKKIEEGLRNNDIKELHELAIVYRGYSPNQSDDISVIGDQNPEDIDQNKFLLLGGRNIYNGSIQLTKKDRYIELNKKDTFQRSILKPGDIIISLLFANRKIYFYSLQDPSAVVNSSCAIIRSPDNKYLYTYLKSIEGRDLFIAQATQGLKGATIPNLTIKELKKIKIPILPLDNLNQISTESIWSLNENESIEFSLQLKKLKQFPDLKFLADTVENFIKEANSIKHLINKGESKNLEFKQTYQYDIKLKQSNKELLSNIAKVCASFCNTDDGILLIGVTDECNIYGIENEFPSDDKFLQHFNNSIIKSKLNLRTNKRVDASIIEVDGHKICKVECKKGDREVYFNNQLYVRIGPTSTPLPLNEVVDYVNKNFRKAK